jgi:hypothetical protein
MLIPELEEVRTVLLNKKKKKKKRIFLTGKSSAEQKEVTKSK